MNKNIFAILIFGLILVGCDDLFEPAIENISSLDMMYKDANYAQGILLNGYTRIPGTSTSFNDVATDDAVTNNRTSNYLKMATGQWTSSNNPMDQWTNSRAAIQYLNIMLANSDKVPWSAIETRKIMFNDRIKGEAYGLRAMYMYLLLQAHGGWTTGGQLLGVPIVTEPEDNNSNFNMPRETFEVCMQQFYSDVNKALELLPTDFEDISDDSQVPAKYKSLGISASEYSLVFGAQFRQRMTGRIVKAIRAKASLLAASPAYNSGNTTTWADAANYAAEVLDLIGGVRGLDPVGLTWFNNKAVIDGLKDGVNPPEVLWRGDGSGTNRTLETDNFPPTLYGSGRVNPTQNLVDAFPMVNGYPISAAGSGYSAGTPYVNRDPRLEYYILINGSKAGVNNTTIFTSADATTNDGLNRVETSTRTGYYMRKHLRQDVNLNPSSPSDQKHCNPHIRYTEIFLAYAEAANEAWGPTNSNGKAYSAYDVIKAIRQRAGLGVSGTDPYLESIKSNKDEVRKLIRNERRLELCFEGTRFWDLRRWNEKITDTASGVSITGGTHTGINVENRVYSDYMYHGPIPYSELLKFNALEQNKGW